MDNHRDLIPNGNGGLSQLPGWLRGVTLLVVQFGIPGVIALFLVYVGAQQIPRIGAIVEATNTRVAELEKQLAASDARQAELYRMLQRICSNTARHEDERGRCFDK
jgi:hypothetical protein